MDYKHRVPGNKRKSNRRAGGSPLPVRWIVIAGGAIVVIGALWSMFSGNGDKKATVPVNTTISQPIQMPPMGPPAPAKAKEPLKKVEKAAEKPPAEAPQAKVEPAETKESTPPPKPPAPEVRFTFYKILPEKEVIIQESEIRELKLDERLGKQLKPQQYEIQVGSYNSLAEAEQLKAKLSQLKVRSRVESMKIESVEWHRVKIGPFDKVSDADRVRDYLKQNQITSVVQKSK
jgi:cell division septation protein DedD